MSTAKMLPDSTQCDAKLESRLSKKRKHVERSKAKKTQNSSGKRSSRKKRRSSVDDYCKDDLDLTRIVLPIGDYITDRHEMLKQLFHCVTGASLQRALPVCLKEMALSELQQRCLEQLEVMSKKRIRRILAGDDPATISSSGTEDETTDEDIQDDSQALDDTVENHAVDSTCQNDLSGDQESDVDQIEPVGGDVDPATIPMDSTAALPEDSDTEQMDLDVPDEEEEEPVEVPTEIELHPLSEEDVYESGSEEGELRSVHSDNPDDAKMYEIVGEVADVQPTNETVIKIEQVDNSDDIQLCSEMNHSPSYQTVTKSRISIKERTKVSMPNIDTSVKSHIKKEKPISVSQIEKTTHSSTVELKSVNSDIRVIKKIGRITLSRMRPSTAPTPVSIPTSNPNTRGIDISSAICSRIHDDAKPAADASQGQLEILELEMRARAIKAMLMRITRETNDT